MQAKKCSELLLHTQGLLADQQSQVARAKKFIEDTSRELVQVTHQLQVARQENGEIHEMLQAASSDLERTQAMRTACMDERFFVSWEAHTSIGHRTVDAAAVAPGAGATTSMACCRSPGSRAKNPITSKDGASGTTPVVSTRPWVGRMLNSPHAAAGTRIDPAVSVPTPRSAASPATAEADPDDDPPQYESSSNELIGGDPSPTLPISE